MEFTLQTGFYFKNSSFSTKYVPTQKSAEDLEDQDIADGTGKCTLMHSRSAYMSGDSLQFEYFNAYKDVAHDFFLCWHSKA